MKRLALLATIGALAATTIAFAFDDPPAEDETVTLAEATDIVLHEGAEEAAVVGEEETAVVGTGSANNYCQSSLNSYGTMAIMGYAGSLELSDGTFALTVTGAAARPLSWGMFTRGVAPIGNFAFGNGFLCVSPFPPGIKKFPTQHLGNGNVTLSMEERPDLFTFAEPFATWYFQFWYRDPPAPPAFFNLSDGLQVTFGP